MRNYFGVAICGAAVVAASAGAAAPVVKETVDLGMTVTEASYAAVCSSPYGAAVFVWATFEGEPSAGSLQVVRPGKKPFRLDGIWSAALNEKWERVAVGEQLKVVDNTVSPPYERAATLSRELGLDAPALTGMLYYDGFAGNGYVTRPVVYNVGGGKRTPLVFAGGDFIDWAGANQLILGREIGRSKTPGASGLDLYGYDLKKKAAALLSQGDEALRNLEPKLSTGVRSSPYLPAVWRLVLRPGDDTPPAEAPGRGGAFVTVGGRVAWRPAEGEPVDVAEGIPLAASAAGEVLLVAQPASGGYKVRALTLAW